jgi:hypothetical protein
LFLRAALPSQTEEAVSILSEDLLISTAKLLHSTEVRKTGIFILSVFCSICIFQLLIFGKPWLLEMYVLRSVLKA